MPCLMLCIICITVFNLSFLLPISLTFIWYSFIYYTFGHLFAPQKFECISFVICIHVNFLTLLKCHSDHVALHFDVLTFINSRTSNFNQESLLLVDQCFLKYHLLPMLVY